MRRIRRFFWGLFLLLDGVLIALFMAGYAAWYVHPGGIWWWIQLVAIGLPYLSLAVGAATGVMALARRWGGLAVHLALGGLIVLRFGLWPPPEAPPRTDADLTLLTFNTPGGWAQDPAARTAGLAELVQTVAPHLASFQESNVVFTPRAPHLHTPDYLDVLTEVLGYQIRSPGPADRRAATANPVFGVIPLLAVSVDSLRPEKKDKLAKVLRVQFDWQGRPAVLYNIHLHTYGDAKPWNTPTTDYFDPGVWRKYIRQFRYALRARALEAERLRARLDAETLPVIVTGDFNSTPHNWVYRHIAHGLRDAFAEAGRGWGLTYHVRRPFVRIDYVLASPAWEVRAAYVPDVVLSDHRPLVARLRWR